MNNKAFAKRAVCVLIAAMLAASLCMGCGGSAAPEGKSADSTVSATETAEKEEVKTAEKEPEKESAPAEESSSGKEAGISGKAAVITNYEAECEIDGTLYSSGRYSKIQLSDEWKDKYPELAGGIDGLNKDWEDTVKSNVALYAPWAMDRDPKGEWTFWLNMEAKLLRADDRLVCISNTTDDYSGGAHPYYSTAIWNYDPVSGRDLKLKAVLDDDRDFTRHVLDELNEAYPKEGFEEDDFFDVPATLDAMYESQGLYDGPEFTYFIDDKGLNIHFGIYQIAPYASGTFDILMSYEEYPDLVKDRYKPEGVVDADGIAEYKKASGTVMVDPDYDDSYAEEAFTMANPSWGYYASDRAVPAGSLIQLDKVSDKKYEWLDTDKWITDNGYEGMQLPYTDGEYYYEPYGPSEYDYMFQCLRIYEGTDDTGSVAYDFDFTVLCNGPDEIALRNSNTTQFIRYAKIVDNVLYVSTIHNGYSSNEPESNYVTAISLDDCSVLWKSAPLVCNSQNFVIEGDALICGYGFTAEPDFIYVLDLGDGSIVKKISVRSAPEAFAADHGQLHVATYNSDYVFQISFG